MENFEKVDEEDILSYWMHIEGYEIFISGYQRTIYEQASDEDELSELSLFVNIVINDSEDIEEYESTLLEFIYSGSKAGLISELKKYIKINNERFTISSSTYQMKLPFTEL